MRFGLCVIGVTLTTAAFGLEGKFVSDKDTCCIISAKGGAVVDAAGRIPAERIVAKGVEFVKDADFGEVMRFTGAPNGGLDIPDEGKIGFENGLTLEGWVWIEKEGASSEFTFANKFGKNWDRHTFETSIGWRCFTVGMFGVVGEKIDFTEEELKHHWGFRPGGIYGARRVGSHGNIRIPLEKWTHVAYTFDPRRALHRIWVNGSLDREWFDWHTLSQELADDDAAKVEIFKKAKNVRLAQLRISSRPHDFGYTPPARVFVHENTYRKEGGYVNVQPIRDDIPLPIEVEVTNAQVPGKVGMTNAVLNSRFRAINVLIPNTAHECSTSHLVVKLRKDAREIWRYETLIRNPRPMAAGSARFLNGTGPWVMPEKPEWWINDDNSFTYKGRPIFPLMVYFGRTNCFDKIVDLGFNVISLRAPRGVKPYQWRSAVEPYFAKAAARGVTIVPSGEKEGRPAQGLHFTYDEPYSFNFEGFRQGWMNQRDGRAHQSLLPKVVSQNNWSRYRETSMCCDVLAPDPYNKGRTPFRNVHDFTRAAWLDMDGKKPVITIIANYGTDKFRPHYEDLRTMCYLAIVGGATGLAFYSWDESDVPGGNMDTEQKPEQLESYKKLFAEFKALTPALATGNVGIPKVEPADPRGFFPCIKKGRDGKVYLIVCSDLYRSAMKRIVIPSAKGRKAKLLYGPDRVGKFKVKDEIVFSADGRGEVSLPPESTAVYVFEK